MALLAALLAVGCGAPLVPTPRTGPHVNEEPVLVPYPPPPARVEIIPSPPPELTQPVWIDGEWQWKGRRWVWLRGRWENDNPGAYWAPAAVVRNSDGTIAFFPGQWRQ